MKAESKVNTDSANVRGSRYKDRVSVFLRSRRGKMFGVAEVAALAGSCLILLLVLFSYLYFLVPARSQVASANADRKQLQTNLQTLRGVVDKEEDTKHTVDKIATSLGKFETDFLMRQDQGRMQLYEELNELIIKNGVRNTSGPTYTTLEPEGTKTAGGKNTATKWQSFYPGIVVLMTVEGQYENVRRFIRDVERSRQFVVINEVELQRARDTNAPVSVEAVVSESGASPVNPGSGSRGSLVSLQLSMATYFQREAVAGQE
ncbi:MAG TPA: GspMb/PilO family protein [Pyrinomonadaceae bacterium]|nr:GspMb/PilO family protein [Pyrinomonadaceae bacterium]